jgi:glutathione-regulated potassium-efflux system ancillary protein KefG
VKADPDRRAVARAEPAAPVLVLYAHPAPHKSRVNRHLAGAASRVPGVTVRDLYELYPDFAIDVREEQRQLESHGALVLQHPLYWYSAPALVKEWLDLVLEYGWAYGPGGGALHGKTWLHAVTAGGAAEAYCGGGKNRHTVREFLLPFEETAGLCGMRFLAPLVVHGARGLGEGEVEAWCRRYVAVLESLRDGRVDFGRAGSLACLNDGFAEMGVER